ncbi:hypothetical protein [Nocardioides jiangxiensis]|uniref:DUF402 domain-containing protein n=1 Tax=Nocardioides jiangxiensis TaxID=3064524 RepID=A0ABT9B598_9ACTN|nr:hypothetical protein [Nocardioides sp. WY-20]MDO7869565.1 hypothetical protein [Nocardioides sp. WY-20]
MPRAEPDALPFALRDGWPEAVPDCRVTIRETGIALGSLMLDDHEWLTISQVPVFSLRIDDHPAADGWTTTDPDGTQTSRFFVIPVRPVTVPVHALAHGRALEEWVWEVHGAVGRLMLWDASASWWLAQDPDLELALVCAPDSKFRAGSDDLSWWSIGSNQGRQKVDDLRARYAVVT